MAICTYTSRFENINVDDKQTLKFLEEVNKLEKDRYRIQGWEIYYGFLWRKRRMVYELLYNYLDQTPSPYSSMEVQLISFGNVFGTATLEQIGAYLLGVLNGHELRKKHDARTNL
jgi:hypothetical protein